LSYVCRDTKKLCEVTARGVAGDTNPVGIDLIHAGIGLQPSNGGFDVENSCGELVFWREPVTCRDHDIASASQLDQQRIVRVAVARAKASTVYAQHTGKQVIGIFWPGNIELQMLVVRIGVLDSAFEQNVLRNIEVGPYSSKLCNRRAQERGQKRL